MVYCIKVYLLNSTVHTRTTQLFWVGNSLSLLLSDLDKNGGDILLTRYLTENGEKPSNPKVKAGQYMKI